ncbi:hypothetical protein [Streptomyces sp. NPDC047097]|uniref:hypothetical protein n=1 Tax=Streptomyces sp. NPDC047097 TaxID=3155260 RepID=UPI0033EEED24
MAYHPYPSRDRALHELARKTPTEPQHTADTDLSNPSVVIGLAFTDLHRALQRISETRREDFVLSSPS